MTLAGPWLTPGRVVDTHSGSLPMTVPRRPLCAGSAAVLLAALLAGPALAAQSGCTLPPREPKVAWDLGPTRGGWCVYFLMAP